MNLSKSFVSVFLFSILACASQAFAAESNLHCEGLGILDASIKSGLDLESVVLKTVPAASVPDAQDASDVGTVYNNFNSDRALKIATAEGKVIPGKVVAFKIGDQTAWGYVLILPTDFATKTEKFKASMFDYEPREIGDGGNYHDLICSLSGGE